MKEPALAARLIFLGLRIADRYKWNLFTASATISAGIISSYYLSHKTLPMLMFFAHILCWLALSAQLIEPLLILSYAPIRKIFGNTKYRTVMANSAIQSSVLLVFLHFFLTR